MTFANWADRDREFDEAEELYAKGNVAAAYNKYAALAQDYIDHRFTADLPFDLIVFSRWAEIAENLQRFQLAEEIYRHLRQRYLAKEMTCAADSVASQLSRVLVSTNRCAEALACIESMTCGPGHLDSLVFTDAGFAAWEARFQWPESAGINDATAVLIAVRVLREIARCEMRRGAYRNSIAAFQRALLHCTHTDSLQRQASAILPELAAAFLEFGDFAAVRTTLAEMPSEVPAAARGRQLEIEAWTDLFQGGLASSIKKLENARQLLVDAGLTEAAVIETLNLASLLISLGLLTRAEAELDWLPPDLLNDNAVSRMKSLRALVAARVEPTSENQISAPAAILLQAARKPKQKTPDTNRPDAYRDTEAQGGFLNAFESACLTFLSLLGTDNYSAAAEQMDGMQSAFGSSDSTLVQAQLLCCSGLLRYYEKDYKQARALLEEAAASLKSAGNRFYGWQCLKYLGWACWRAGDFDAFRRYLDNSDDMLEAISESLDPTDRAAFRLNKWTEEEMHLSEHLHKANRLSTAFLGTARLLLSLDSAMQYIDEHRRYIRQRCVLGSARAHVTAAFRTFARTFDEPVLRFVVLPDRLVTIVVNGWNSRILESAVTRAGVRKLVADFHSGVRGAAVNPTPEAQRPAHEALKALAQAIHLGEALKNLPPSGLLRILPDDCLHGVPFAALPVDGDEILADRFATVIGSDWRRPSPDARPTRADGALVGWLSYENCDEPRIHPLATAHAQATAVATALRTTPTDESEMTRAVLLERIPQYGQVHVVCHGIFRPDDPASSGLVLLTPDFEAETLSLTDLWNIDVSRIQHFGLGSCWGADDYVSPGRYIVSLPETLIQGGVDEVFACLWEVNGLIATDLMEMYYQERTRVSAPEALRRAQTRLRNANDPRYTSWYWWAGYRVYSDSL